MANSVIQWVILTLSGSLNLFTVPPTEDYGQFSDSNESMRHWVTLRISQFACQWKLARDYDSLSHLDAESPNSSGGQFTDSLSHISTEWLFKRLSSGYDMKFYLQFIINNKLSSVYLIVKLLLALSTISILACKWCSEVYQILCRYDKISLMRDVTFSVHKYMSLLEVKHCGF